MRTTKVVVILPLLLTLAMSVQAWAQIRKMETVALDFRESTQPAFDLPAAALRAATSDAAAIVGSDEIGVISTGKLADIVLLDADPLANIRNTRRIWRVIKNGRVYER